MFGQGRPHNPTTLLRALVICACLALIARGDLSAAEWNLRVRLAWGGETRVWQGTMQLQGGEIRAATPLGLEPDSPGSMLLVNASQVRVLPRTPRSYESCDLLLRGDERSVLVVNLSGGDPAKTIELPFAKLLKGLQSLPLDDRGNRLLVQRSPGDALRVDLGESPLVFAPQERRKLNAQPNMAELPPNAALTWQLQVLQGRSEVEVSSQTKEVKTDAQGGLAEENFDWETPAAEGVYELKLTLNAKRTLPTITPSLTPTLVRNKSILERRVQFVVLANETPAVSRGENWLTELEIDPAGPRWWERLTRMPSLKSLPSFASGPVGDSRPGSRTHNGRTWVELGPKNWQAYPLSVARPGEPHILEIEYPSDLKQTLGVSLVEPNAAGIVGPNGLDSGFEVREPSAGHLPKIERHRLIIWPQTKAPLVLLVNRSDDGAAVYGRVRLLSGPAGLEPLLPPEMESAGRGYIAYFDKALLARAFGGDEALDVTKRTLADWLMFYRSGRRMVDYLKHAGYSAAVIPALSEGATLYPSELLQPTLSSDSGQYFESGQDPVRKDVLEMLFRMHDRTGLQLIPSLQFASPLPELEAFRHAEPAEAIGIEPLGPDGKNWISRFGTRQGQGSYYNPLDPRVREAMKDVFLEVADRYAKHPSFGGLALYVGPESYLVLPDELAGCDDVTLDRFLREMRLAPPAGGLQTMQAKLEFLRGPQRGDWLHWRAQQITAFIDDLRRELQQRRPDAKLILVGSDLCMDSVTRQTIRPTLPLDNLGDALFLHHGLDTAALARLPNVVVPRPYRQWPVAPPAITPLLSRWNQAVEIDRLFTPATAVHFHEPAQLRLQSFDDLSPFGRDKTHTWFVAQISPAGAAARERFTRNLADHDCRTILDGGWMPVMGQEENLRPFLETYRRLPAEPFRTHEQAGGKLGSPVIVRTLARDNALWFYAVNDSPWPTRVEIDFRGAPTTRFEPLGAARAAVQGGMNGLKVSVALEPYDLVGGKLVGGAANLEAWRATPHQDVDAELRDRIRDAKLRANLLRMQQPLAKVRNPGFELPPANGAIPGWIHVKGAGVLVETAADKLAEGQAALHLASTSPGPGKRAPVVWVRSDQFDTPATGRLKLVASLRIADPAKQPKLRMAVEGKLEGRPYYKAANVGAAEGGAPASPLGPTWAKYKFLLTDLPLNGLTNLRIGFDLMDEGEVWIDEVQVFDLPFEDVERDELMKMIATAELQLDSGRQAECLRFLESPWAVFLRRFANIDAARLAAQVPPPAAGKGPLPLPANAPAEPPPVQESRGVLDRVRGLTPKWPFR